jgi:uncharacterized protein (TIRG00374 family)
MKRRAAILLAVKLLVSAALIFVVVRGADVGRILDTMTAADTPLLLLAFAMFFVGYALTATRWRLLLGAQGIETRTGFLVKSFMVAMFFNNLLPTTVGGDAVRVYDSWRLGGSKARAVTVIFVDRLLGLLALILLACAGAFFADRLTERVPALPLWIGSAAVTALLLAGLIFARSEARVGRLRTIGRRLPGVLRRAVSKLAGALALFRGRHDVLACALLLSFALQVNVVLHFYVIALALDLPVPLHAFFLIVPVATVTMMLPISINGIGVREGAFAVLLAAYGVDSAAAVAFAWISYGFILGQGVLGGVVFALRRDRSRASRSHRQTGEVRWSRQESE